MSTWEDIGYGDRLPSEDEADDPRFLEKPILFGEWLETQDDEMKTRVRRVFPSLKILGVKP